MLVCEHASNYIPSHLSNLGLTEDVLHSHVAIDIGALELAQSISLLLDAPMVASEVSRLVYDVNRPPNALDAMPQQSEIHTIPGNLDLGEEEIQFRVNQYYQPFKQAIKKQLAEFDQKPILITVHSFTPVYHGEHRSVDVGFIYSKPNSLALNLVSRGQQQEDFNVQANAPYGPEHGVTHTLDLHGNENDLLNVMIEVKNSLLETPQQLELMARFLATLISETASSCGYSIPPDRNHAPLF